MLFVLGGDEAPDRYRGRVPAEALALAGAQTRVIHSLSAELWPALRWAEAVVLVRVAVVPRIADALTRLREQRPGVPVICDFDDPLFMEIPATASSGGWGLEQFAWSLHFADTFTGTTRALCDAAQQITGRPAHPIPNTAGVALRRIARRAASVPRIPGGMRLGFLSGSGTHNTFWQQIEPQVLQFLAADRRARLDLVGLVGLGEQAGRYRRQIRRFPLLDWQDLPFVTAQLDLLLVPNSDPAPWRDMKSAVKWLEGAHTATTVLASATEPYGAVIEDGVDGFLAGDDWSADLERARGRTRSVGMRARDRVERDFSTERLAAQWRQVLTSAADRARDAAPPVPPLPSDFPLSPEPASGELGDGGRVKARPTPRHIVGCMRNPAS